MIRDGRLQALAAEDLAPTSYPTLFRHAYWSRRLLRKVTITPYGFVADEHFDLGEVLPDKWQGWAMKHYIFMIREPKAAGRPCSVARRLV